MNLEGEIDGVYFVTNYDPFSDLRLLPESTLIVYFNEVMNITMVNRSENEKW